MERSLEVESPLAGRLIGVSRQTIRAHVVAGRLPARRVGVRGKLRIQVADLRKFAETYNYDWNESALAEVQTQA